MVGSSPGANIQDDANQLRSLTTMIMNGQEEGDYHRIDHSGPYIAVNQSTHKDAILDFTLRSKVNANLHPLSGTNKRRVSHVMCV
jgi:hypothetical protein